MKKSEIMRYLEQEKLVAVIRGETEDEIIKIADAVVAGGIYFLEITFTIPFAQDIIKILAKRYEDNPKVVVGAGTCLDVETAKIAISSGAQFVVSPHFDKEIIKLCNVYQVQAFPGATTVTDMVDCLRYGAEVIKLFPGDLFGPSSIKNFKGPLPQAEFMPTGGVGLNNITQWLEAGAYGIGIGGSLTKGAKTGDFEAITAEAQKYVEAVQLYAQK